MSRTISSAAIRLALTFIRARLSLASRKYAASASISVRISSSSDEVRVLSVNEDRTDVAAALPVTPTGVPQSEHVMS